MVYGNNVNDSSVSLIFGQEAEWWKVRWAGLYVRSQQSMTVTLNRRNTTSFYPPINIHYLYSNYYTCRNKYEHKVLFDKLFKLQPSIDIGH